MASENSNAPPFSRSADNNKDHILQKLQDVLSVDARVLEVASGTGQHALYFSERMKRLMWQPSDMDLDVFQLARTVRENSRPNLCKPIELDIGNWPDLPTSFDAVYSANCLHIISEDLIAPYVIGVADSLREGGLMLLYGPFKYSGDFTTSSNAEFNSFLQNTYEGGGIKDFEFVDELAQSHGLNLVQDCSMPANNQFIVWQKQF